MRAMRPDAPYFIILLCLTPDTFTCQEESAATQWVRLSAYAAMRPDAPYFIILLCLTPLRQTILLVRGRVLPLNGSDCLLMRQCAQMHPTLLFYSVYNAITPDDFTCQGESAATQWVNQTVCLCGNAPRCTLLYYFTLSNAITPDDFTCQGESAATQWVNQTVYLCGNAPRCTLLYYFTLSNAITPDDFTCQGESAATQWVNTY